MSGPAGSGRPAVDDDLRSRIDELFCELCSILSPSGEEERIAERLAELCAGAGLTDQLVDETGNLYARRPGPDGDRPRRPAALVFCAHMDTVGVASETIDPVLVDDGWENEHEAIIGADNKAAIAVMLACIERLDRAGDTPGVPVELLITTGEEQALHGAKHFDVAALAAGSMIYIYDHATPVGGIVSASPTYFRIEAVLHGRAAHAGIRPEDGSSAVIAAARALTAIPHGRLDDETTANVGAIHGGAAPGGTTNVVADRCTISAEVRSLDEDRAAAVVAEITDALQEAANDPRDPCDLDIEVERLFGGYRHTANAPIVAPAKRALERCGHEPELITTGGGSDANALMANGAVALCIANGTERNHEPTERVSRSALEQMAAVTFALIDEVSADAGAPAR